MTKGVYVLKLNSGKYYVGKSNNIESRIKEHMRITDKCAKFVKDNGGVYKSKSLITAPQDNLSDWERNETIAQMIKHGYDNVRGWEFTGNKLTKSNYETIKTLIMGQTDRCRKCGCKGHFSNKCYGKKSHWLVILDNLINKPIKSKISNDDIIDNKPIKLKISNDDIISNMLEHCETKKKI